MGVAQHQADLQGPTGRALVCVKWILFVITASFTATLWVEGTNRRLLVFWAGLFVAVSAAIVFRGGWLIPCTICGVLGGFLLDPPVQGGPADAQIMQTVWLIIIGTVIGCVTGLLVDANKPSSDR